MDPKRFLFVSADAALIGDVAWQVAREGHDVRYYVEAESDREIADGFVTKTDDWRSEVEWADTVVFDDIWVGSEVGTGALAEALRAGAEIFADKIGVLLARRRDELAGLAQGPDDPGLLQRLHARKDRGGADLLANAGRLGTGLALAVLAILLIQPGQVLARHRLVALFGKAQPARNGERGGRMVAGDHAHADAGPIAVAVGGHLAAPCADRRLSAATSQRVLFR